MAISVESIHTCEDNADPEDEIATASKRIDTPVYLPPNDSSEAAADKRAHNCKEVSVPFEDVCPVGAIDDTSAQVVGFLVEDGGFWRLLLGIRLSTNQNLPIAYSKGATDSQSAARSRSG